MGWWVWGGRLRSWLWLWLFLWEGYAQALFVLRRLGERIDFSVAGCVARNSAFVAAQMLCASMYDCCCCSRATLASAKPEARFAFPDKWLEESQIPYLNGILLYSHTATKLFRRHDTAYTRFIVAFHAAQRLQRQRCTRDLGAANALHKFREYKIWKAAMAA